MTPERARMLMAMADAHDKMEADFLSHATFDRDRSHDGSDYNQHYLDYGPPPGAEEAFQAAMAGVLDTSIVSSHPDVIAAKAILTDLRALTGDPSTAIIAELRKLADPDG
jgi:hypothetical protein